MATTSSFDSSSHRRSGRHMTKDGMDSLERRVGEALRDLLQATSKLSLAQTWLEQLKRDNERWREFARAEDEVQFLKEAEAQYRGFYLGLKAASEYIARIKRSDHNMEDL